MRHGEEGTIETRELFYLVPHWALDGLQSVDRFDANKVASTLSDTDRDIMDINPWKVALEHTGLLPFNHLLNVEGKGWHWNSVPLDAQIKSSIELLQYEDTPLKETQGDIKPESLIDIVEIHKGLKNRKYLVILKPGSASLDNITVIGAIGDAIMEKGLGTRVLARVLRNMLPTWAALN